MPSRLASVLKSNEFHVLNMAHDTVLTCLYLFQSHGTTRVGQMWPFVSVVSMYSTLIPPPPLSSQIFSLISATCTRHPRVSFSCHLKSSVLPIPQRYIKVIGRSSLQHVSAQLPGFSLISCRPLITNKYHLLLH